MRNRLGSLTPCACGSIADQHGDLTIAAPDLAVSPQAGVWVLVVYRWTDGTPLGGIQSLLIGRGSTMFLSARRC